MKHVRDKEAKIGAGLLAGRVFRLMAGVGEWAAGKGIKTRKRFFDSGSIPLFLSHRPKSGRILLPELRTITSSSIYNTATSIHQHRCMQNKKKRSQQKPGMASGIRQKLLQLFIDVFLPAEIYYDRCIAYADKLVYYWAHVLFFSGAVFMIFEVTSIDNTIHGMSLVWNACFAGILIAAVLILILKQTNPSILYERKLRTNLLGAIVLGCIFVSASVASFVNHRFPGEYQNCCSYSIEEKARNIRRGGCWLYLKVSDDGEERFEVTLDLYNSVKEGGQVVLCTRKGALGFDFVKEFRLVDH